MRVSTKTCAHGQNRGASGFLRQPCSCCREIIDPPTLGFNSRLISTANVHPQRRKVLRVRGERTALYLEVGAAVDIRRVRRCNVPIYPRAVLVRWPIDRPHKNGGTIVQYRRIPVHASCTLRIQGAVFGRKAAPLANPQALTDDGRALHHDKANSAVCFTCAQQRQLQYYCSSDSCSALAHPD